MRSLVLAMLLACAAPGAIADVKPLPRSQWPKSVEAAVPLILATLTASQRSIVAGTTKDSLFLLQGEWGEDIETLLGLNAGNSELVAATCGAQCKVEQATLVLMEAAWSALRK